MKKINLDEFKNYQFLSNLKANPAQKEFAFVITTADMAQNSYKRNIWLYKNNKTMQLTGLDDSGNYIWIDDENILIQTIRDQKDKDVIKEGKELSSFYRININGGEALKQFSLPLFVSRIILIKKDLYAIIGKIDANNPDLYKMNDKQASEVYKSRKENEDYEILDEVPFWLNGTTFVNKHRDALFIYDAKKNKLDRVSSPYESVEAIDVSSDKMEIVYSYDEYKTMSKRFSKVKVYDINSDKIKELISKDGYMIRDLKYTSIGYGMIASTGEKHGINENSQFYVIDAKDTVSLVNEYDNAIGSSVGSDSRLGGGKAIKYANNQYYFTTTIVDSSHLYINDGTVKPLVEFTGSIDDFDLHNDKIVYIGMHDQKLQEIYEYDPTKKTTKQLTKINEKVLSGKYVAEPEKVCLKSHGLDIEGWVLKPVDYNPKKKYPAILDIHGGPKTVYGEVFYHEMQYWANLGYFVFFTNPKGSDGRGNSFMDIRGAYGTVDYDNLMDFTDEVIKKYPAINTKKIAVTGGSYGGFMTNWIIGHTDRFVCAASQRSISNWISFYGVSDIGIRFALDQQGVDELYGGQEKLWWHSPLKYADQVKTPTLFIHSDQDYRCPMEQGMQMYSALIERGVETRLVYFKGENHELSRGGKPLHRIKRLKEMTEWIEKYTR